MAFSKQVFRWLEASSEDPLPTKKVMLRAIEIVEPEEISAEPLLALLNAISAQLAGTSY